MISSGGVSAKVLTGTVIGVRSWDGYGSIPIDTFLVGWTSIYQLFWGSLGTRVLTHPQMSSKDTVDQSLSEYWVISGPSQNFSRPQSINNQLWEHQCWSIYCVHSAGNQQIMVSFGHCAQGCAPWHSKRQPHRLLVAADAATKPIPAWYLE